MHGRYGRYRIRASRADHSTHWALTGRALLRTHPARMHPQHNLQACHQARVAHGAWRWLGTSPVPSRLLPSHICPRVADWVKRSTMSRQLAYFLSESAHTHKPHHTRSHTLLVRFACNERHAVVCLRVAQTFPPQRPAFQGSLRPSRRSRGGTRRHAIPLPTRRTMPSYM